MAFTTEDFMGGIEKSFVFFKKHLKGLKEEQWHWKPYPECKSIYETLSHLVTDYRAAVQSFSTGEEPDYEGLSVTAATEAGGNLERQLEILEASHAELCAFLRETYGDASPETPAKMWGIDSEVGLLIAYISSEDFYHAGQVAFIRMASDPTWDYYANVYGE